jgi:uncharacterized DUF497 family protein
MDYEWDPAKADANTAKHGIHFPDAVSVFEDDAAFTVHDPHIDEERFLTIGADAIGRILVVAYTFRIRKIRIISARKATRAERMHYAKGQR